MSKDPVFQTLALIGLGLVGSSVARAVKAHGLAATVVGHARSVETRETAMRLGFLDRVEADPAAAVANADCVMVCTPLSAIPIVAKAFAPALKPGAIVTDVGSVKSNVIRDLGPLLPDGVVFVPGHPLAGTEHSGPESGFAELFDGRWCVLTPDKTTPRAAVDRIARLWRGMGSEVEIMTAEHHDKVMAITSHLPHLIAYTIVGTAVDLEDDIKGEVIRFAATGFRDFTRIAASDPVMWRDVFLANKEPMLEMIQRFTEDLTALQRAIRKGDGDTLQDLFTRTRAIRRGVIDAKQA